MPLPSRMLCLVCVCLFVEGGKGGGRVCVSPANAPGIVHLVTWPLFRCLG